jgi:ribosomal protein S18 acetylase RimI-like enzyme
MTVTIHRAERWEEFEEILIKSMQEMPWFSYPNPADYLIREELEELHADFENVDHYFLQGKTDDGTSMGALEFTCYQSHASNGIMMPGVPEKYRDSGVGAALLNHQEEILRERKISHLVATLKFRTLESVQWHIDLLRQHGFKEHRPEGIQMIATLDAVENSSDDTEIQFRNRDNYTLEDFTQFAIRAYASTPEDLAIHGWDRSVTDPEVIRQVHTRTFEGGHGYSPSQWWKVATLEGVPAGYIIGFDFDPTSNRKRGVIGNMGVFPEFRRKGIALSLIRTLFQEFKNAGLEYAMVGTPHNNIPAILAYEKAGFREANRLRRFLKEL